MYSYEAALSSALSSLARLSVAEPQVTSIKINTQYVIFQIGQAILLVYEQNFFLPSHLSPALQQ